MEETLHNGQRGVSLMMLALCSAVIFGTLGLAVDLGRMFIVKNELQTFADASALAACAKLNGSASGITAANAIATQGPLGSAGSNRWNFDTATIANITTGFATSFHGTYDSAAMAETVNPNTYAFVSVTPQATMSLFFLPLISRIPYRYTVSAKAIAGEMKQTGGVTGGGLAPFAPEAHNIDDTTNFGFTPGHIYTLKWDNRGTTTCSGDLNDPWPTGENGEPSPQHGFVDIGTGDSESNIKDAIVNSDYPLAGTIISAKPPNNTLDAVPGDLAAAIFEALRSRSAEDSDQTATDYFSDYAGNGRRILVVPVSQTWGLENGKEVGSANVIVMGFASFFIAPSARISGTSGPFCAEYIGGGTSWSGPAGASDRTVTYTIALFQ